MVRNIFIIKVQNTCYVSKCARRYINTSVNHTKSSKDIHYSNNKRQQHSTRPLFYPSERKRDYYEVLGVPKDANSATIKKAYYELAKKYHPDSSSSTPESSKKFAEISAAYEVLRDEKKRAQYDK